MFVTKSRYNEDFAKINELIKDIKSDCSNQLKTIESLSETVQQQAELISSMEEKLDITYRNAPAIRMDSTAPYCAIEYISEDAPDGKLKTVVRWNDEFIYMLRKSGYTQLDEEDLIAAYLKNHLSEVMNEV